LAVETAQPDAERQSRQGLSKRTLKRTLWTQNAYAMSEYVDAKRALERLHRELMELNPSAARSLEEGMEETLTVHRLRVPSQLRPPWPART
jgi:hypothetical protein